MDWTLLHALNGYLFRHDAIEDPLLFYVNASEALFIATLAIACLAAHGDRYRIWRRAAVAAGLSAGLGLSIAKLVSELIDRMRPFVADPGGVHTFASHAADAGFPSDHATASFAIAVAIVLRSRRWGIVALIAAAVLSIGRVGIGIHYPSDVGTGALLGAACALLLWSRPLRTRVDALADFAGALWDRALDRSAARLGLAWRS